jgi:hypothetical protein
LEYWVSIEADFQQHYGLDLAQFIDLRTGRWLRVRILGLLSIESRLRYDLYPPKK